MPASIAKTLRHKPGLAMKFRVLTAVLAAGVLGACTNADWDHALSYAGIGDSEKPAAAPQAETATAPAPISAPAPSGWCDQIAKSAQTEAAEQGFDAATQQHRAQVVYAQCASSPSSAAAN
jgi:hypothetical protein